MSSVSEDKSFKMIYWHPEHFCPDDMLIKWCFNQADMMQTIQKVVFLFCVSHISVASIGYIAIKKPA